MEPIELFVINNGVEKKDMPLEGFDPSTFGLQDQRSTTEL